MKKQTLFFAAMALVFCSCSVQKSVSTLSYSEYRTDELNIVPLVAELNISGKRIEYSEKISVDFEELSPKEAKNLVEELKGNVLYHAIKKYNADIMVTPLTNVIKEGNGTLIITITGYPATYKNIRNATKDDTWFVEVGKPAQSNDQQPTDQEKKFKIF